MMRTTLAGSVALAAFSVVLPLGAAAQAEGPQPAAEKQVDFARDVLPIFQARCFDCHGPDLQEGQLRLDARKVVLDPGRKKPLVVPGKPAASLLYQRVSAEEEAQRMPPDDDPLTAEQLALLAAWIESGAKWPENVGSLADAVTHWAYEAPVRPALPEVMDGSWPHNEIDHFILSRLEREGLAPSPAADKETLIRRVYLDLTGLPPTIEEIDAFLADDRADAYEHLVDKLLASPHYGERWARPWLDLARHADSNGFQRDGPREVWAYRDWVIRAINSDMPFDQFTIEQLAGDLLPDATLAQRIATGFHRGPTVNVEAGTDQEENRVNAVFDRVNVTGTVWLGTSIGCAQCHEHKYDPFTQEDYYRLFAFFNNTRIETEGHGTRRDFIGPMATLPLSPDKKARREQLADRMEKMDDELQAAIDAALEGFAGWQERCQAEPEVMKKVPKNIRAILKVEAEKRNDKQKQQLREHFLSTQPEVKELRNTVKDLEGKLKKLDPPTTLVMQEREEPRMTNVFVRGNFLDKGEQVEPGVPEVLHDWPDGAPENRLGLARWLVSPDNPLVGRVTVNRWWAEFFGHGLVATPEDFGSQGERPTHPALLDWLAVEFIDGGWSMKDIHRLIVTSATYRQDSRITPELLQRDPENRLYARGPRFRLSAEAIRDTALAVSGLLSKKMGGPPIRPPQPDGVWRVTGNVDNTYRTSADGEQHRRSIYVVWRRSSPYPSFVNFDAPDRAACVVKRPRTNTPLQALTLLNDPVYIEMAKSLATRILTDREGLSPDERVEYAFRLTLGRRPSSEERGHLVGLFKQERERFEKDPKRAEKLLGHWPVPEGADASELAAWVYVANILLNLDETITKS